MKTKNNANEIWMKKLRVLMNRFSFEPSSVDLIYEQGQGGPNALWGNGRRYFLHLRDNKGCEKKILAADLSTTSGGMGVERWEINRQGRKKVLSVYFVMNILGHDLDQWVHYDLRNGEVLKDFKGQMQLQEEHLRESEEARKCEKRPKIVVNAKGEEKPIGE